MDKRENQIRSASKALFISFEGIDGCGKSTLMDHLGTWLEESAIPYLKTREPGGTELGEQIRTLLLNPAHRGMDRRAEVLLYTASRAQLTGEVIAPALRKGIWVLADRYIDATLAYQGFGRTLDIQALRDIQKWATGGLKPHRTVLLDCRVDTAFERMQARKGDPDRIEAEDRSFHERVRAGYLELARSDPERFLVLNAENPLEQVIRDFSEAFLIYLK